MTALAEHCPQLIDVNLNSCDQLTDALLKVDFRRLVCGCWQLTDASVVTLTARCPLLFCVNTEMGGGWQQWSRLAPFEEAL